MTGPPRSQPPPYAGVADLVHPDDLPVPRLPVPPPRGETDLDDADLDAHLDAHLDAGWDAAAREPLGHRVARRFFTLCEHPRTRERTLRLLRAGVDSAVGGRALAAFLGRGALGPLLRSGRIDHATGRIELACAQLGGVAVLRYVTRMEPVASMSLDDLVAMVGPSVDATLTAPYRSGRPRAARRWGVPRR